jgi:type IV fimbrial biogenesis protein FimT
LALDAIMNKKYLRGLTLIEALVVLAIIAISLQVAIPSFQKFTRESRQKSQSNDFLGSLRYARNQAITKRRFVTVCASSNSSSCNSSYWENGWIVYVDNNTNRQVDSGEQILKRYQALTGANSLRTILFAINSSVQFLPTGWLDSTGSFVLCDDRGAGSARGININISGQARVNRGIDVNGNALNCPS